MIKVSSRETFYYKKIFPVFWFGLLFVMLAFIVASACGAHPGIPLPLIALPLIMMGFGYLIMKLLVFDLVDEVYDDGNALVVIFDETEERILLSNIMNVSLTISNPRRVTLVLRTPSRFGKEIVFVPQLKWADAKYLWFKISYVSELIHRIDTLRTA